MANEDRIFFNRIKHYREMLNISQDELAKKMNLKRRNIIAMDEQNSGSNTGVTLNKVYSYIDAFREISKEKSNGQQILILSIDDLFYSN